MTLEENGSNTVTYIQYLLSLEIQLPYKNVTQLLENNGYTISSIQFIEPNNDRQRLTLKSIKTIKKEVDLVLYEKPWSDYLPKVYRNPQLTQFLYGFQLTMFQYSHQMNHIEELFTPEQSNPEFINWLASWFNMSFSSKIALQNRRKILYKLTSLYNTKGTSYYLKEMIFLLTDVTISIKERKSLAEDESNPNISFVVTIIEEPLYSSEKQKKETHQIIEQIIKKEKPIFTQVYFDKSFTKSKIATINQKNDEPIIEEKEIIFRKEVLDKKKILKNMEDENIDNEDNPINKSGYDDFL